MARCTFRIPFQGWKNCIWNCKTSWLQASTWSQIKRWKCYHIYFLISAFSSMCSYSYLWSTFSMKYSNYQWTKSQTNHQSITDRHSKNEGENNQLTTVLLEKCEDDLYQNLTKYLFLRARKQESSEYHNCSLQKKLVDRPELQFHGEWFAGRVVKFKHPKCQPIIEFQHSSGRNRLVCTSFCYCHIVYLINNTLSSEQIRPKIGSAIPEMSTNSARLQVVPIIMSLVVSVIAMTCYCVLDECLMNSIAASLESQLSMYFFFIFLLFTFWIFYVKLSFCLHRKEMSRWIFWSSAPVLSLFRLQWSQRQGTHLWWSHIKLFSNKDYKTGTMESEKALG